MSFDGRGVTRSLLRAANGLGSRGAEALWGAASAAGGFLATGSPSPLWSTSGRERVVAIAPHPDDDAIGCAGTLIRHRRRGDSVWSVVVTDGSRSRALGLGPLSMRTRREREATEAAARMGVECRWIGLPEDAWTDGDGRRSIRRLLIEANPTVVYAPSLIDYHPDHRRVARAVALALADLGTSPGVRIYAIQVPLTPLLTNLIHDVSDLETDIRSVLACYASQRAGVAITQRLHRYAARFYGAETRVEGFCTLAAADYVSLHARRDATFRPLMMRAWSDPLALLVGLPERIKWRSWEKRHGSM